MNFLASHLPRFPAGVVFVLWVTGGVLPAAALENGIILNGAGWMQYGMVGNSSDTVGNKDYNKHSIYSSGVQITLRSRLSEKLDGEVGIGVAASHFITGSVNGYVYSPMIVAPYIAEAGFTYSFWDNESSKLRLRGGFFPYDYNPDVKNLGLYLLRGPVYPGVLISGFETKHVLPVANMLGLQLHHEIGGFQQDFLLTSETEWAPYYDLSPAYVVNYQAGRVFSFGGGVNFYHLIPLNDSISLGRIWSQQQVSLTTGYVLYPTNDTISFKGVKVMARAAIDPKSFFGGNERLGAEDLKVYGEIAVIGLNNDSIHKAIYGDYLHRMPVMVGVNLPAFKLLDYLSLEVEWYGAPFRDDLTGYNHTSGTKPSPLSAVSPVLDSIGQPIYNTDGSPVLKNIKRDNWKWSLNGSKVIRNHFKVSFQVANDHFRPGIYAGDGDNNPPKTEALLITPKDWYMMTKLAYFF